MLNHATSVYIHKCLPCTACSCEGGIRGRLTHALEEEGCAGESLLVGELKEQTAGNGGGGLGSVMEFTSLSLDAAAVMILITHRPVGQHLQEIKCSLY